MTFAAAVREAPAARVVSRLGGQLRQPRRLDGPQPCLVGDYSDDPFDRVGGGGVNLSLFLVEVGRGQVEGPQALEDEGAGPVHRPRGELQFVRVDRHLDAEHELLDDPLVPAPKLLADDRVGRGDEPQRRVGGEGVEDLLDLLARSDQVGEELVLPRGAAAVEVGVLLPPRALLCVQLEDEVVWIEDSRVD